MQTKIKWYVGNPLTNKTRGTYKSVYDPILPMKIYRYMINILKYININLTMGSKDTKWT